MKNQEINRFVKKILILNSIITLFVIIGLLIFQLYSWALGYLLGSLTSNLTFIMHANNVKKMGVSINKPMKNAVASTMLRLFVSAISLFISLLVDWINILATFVGLLVIKIIVIIVSIVIGTNKKGGNVSLQ